MADPSAGREELSNIVRAAQGGDDAAFATLVRAFQDVAVAYATSILRDHHHAEDAAQEAFVEAHRELPRLREPEAFAAWLRTIVFKHCNRLVRRKRHDVTGLDEGAEIASTDPSPHQLAERRELTESITRAVSTLPETEREAVLLYYMGDESLETIAQFLSVNANTIKTRLYAARRRLRAPMTKHLEDTLRAARPSRAPEFAMRVISATLPLQIYYIDERGVKCEAGSTVASRAVGVPSLATCVVEPRHLLSDKEWETTLGLMKDLGIQGLTVEHHVTDAQLARITQLDHLTYIGLRGNTAVTDDGLRTLARLSSLTHLDLGGSGLADGGLRVLRDLPHLESFNCVHTAVTDDGLAHLKHCHRLRRVNVMGTPSGDGVIAALAGKTGLTHLRTGERVTDDGLTLLKELPVFATWRGKESQDTRLTYEPDPNFLLLRGPFTDAGIARLAALRGLYALNLDDRRLGITAAGIRALVDLPHLGWFAFDAKDDAMPIVAAMEHLRFFACQDTVAGDAGFVALSRSPTIEHIWGRRCHNLQSRGFAALSAMPALRGLAVSCRNVDDDALSTLPSFPALREFMSIDVPDDGFRHIGACVSLETLICMYCTNTTDDATTHLARLRTLRRYEAWTTAITDRSLDVLRRLPSLEHVLLHYTAAVTDAGLALLSQLPRLRDVTIEGLPLVTAQGAAVFPPGVRVNILTE